MVRREQEPDANVTHQPASDFDLARFPARDGVCRRMRELMRDFVDGDLDDAASRDLQDHAHDCRDCDVALSRAEYEALRIRRAFAKDAEVAAEAPSDLGARIRDRIEVADRERTEPSADFTRVVMERVNREWRKPTWRERLPRRRMLAAAAVIGGLAIGWVIVPADSETVAARLVATRGDRAVVVDEHGASRAIGRNTAAYHGERVETRGADVRAVLYAPGGGRGFDVGSVETYGDSSLRLTEDGIAFDVGSFRVRSNDELLATRLADASAWLVRGEFDLRIAERTRYDSALSAVPLRSVRLEVLSGHAILERDGRQTTIGEGNVAHFGDWQPLAIEPGLTPELLEASLRGANGVARADLATTPTWRGRVVDESTGLGVAGVAVRLAFAGSATVELTSDRSGAFETPARDADLAVVSVMPPVPTRLERVAARPLALPGGGGDVGTIRLAALRPFWGMVRDHDGAALEGARVVPFVVDDVFGLCDVRDDLAATTDLEGRFELPSLPRGLAPQQSIALVIEHADAPTTAYREIDEGHAIGRTFQLDTPRDVVLAGLPKARSVQIVQGVRGLSTREFVIRDEVVTDETGRVELRGVGPGRIWFHDLSTGEGIAMVPAASGPGTLVADASRENRPVFGKPGGRAFDSVRRRGHRYDAFRRPSPRATSMLTFVDSDAIAVPRTRLFLVDDSGRTEFLGEYHGEAFPFAAPDGPYAVVAIGPDGSVSWVPTDDIAIGHNSIELARDGSVELVPPRPELVDPAIDRTALLRFRMLEGARAGHEFWRVVRLEDRPRVDGLMPGHYVVEFDGVDARLLVEIEPGGAVEVGLPIGVELGR